ncbi:MAG: hypothetical protein OQK78_06285 [Gammaproteobacteria bacterium]|nr:hypothetical protein [Gammaproteobacteria bacterium]
MKKLMTYAGLMIIVLASGNAMARGGGGGSGSGGGAGGGFGASDGFDGFQSNSENAIYGETKKFRNQYQNQHSYQYSGQKEADEDRTAKNSHAYGRNEQ